MTGVVLKGMTWSHPRGFDPMIACSTRWEDRTGVKVEWHKRSLQDFEMYPVEDLARAYDLIVIDHPHVGQITEEKCLLPLELSRHHAERINLRLSSVGKSYPSYYWKGQQWALPIDAAAQVQAYRPDKLSSPAATWNEVLELARHRQVALPLRPPHSLMTLYTLYNNVSDTSADDGNGELLNIQTGALVFDVMREIAELIDPKCLEMDPIDVLEVMAQNDPSITCSPLIYGYVSYSVDGFRAGTVKFGNIARCGNNGHGGSALGGTGIAVSAFREKPDQAMDFAYWVASETCRGPFMPNQAANRVMLSRGTMMP